MSSEQKNVTIISICMLIMGALDVFQGILSPSAKGMFFVSGAFMAFTGLMCFGAARQERFVTAAKIVLITSIVINFAGMIITVLSKLTSAATVGSIASAGLMICVALYSIKTIKKIHE
ncbi:MAG: hypothetical protein K5656_05115 [Lachnospiraceae bacterium]|nr:hypothetical protein [Lachnospiraceae bacterium]